MSLLIFGSRARGTHRPDSDIDLICSTSDTAFERLVLQTFGPDLVAVGGVVDLFVDQGGLLAAPPDNSRQIWLDGDCCHEEVTAAAREISLEDAVALVAQVKLRIAAQIRP